ncbi:MAG: zinc ribbon domain-containing protein [Syntrophobacterales bacterium]|jgi:putative FmdB family regulatory protein|nr:zinc ribbon domain-containing protein [Syntrophobacterales bacterium]
MPIYEYQCEQCGTVTEVLFLGKEQDAACSACGGTRLTKLMSAPNISVKESAASFGAPQEGCCGSPDMCGAGSSCANRGQCFTG